MMQRVFDAIGWIGTGLVLVAVVMRFTQFDQYSTTAALAGLVLVLLYTASQWRDIFQFFTQRQAKYGAMALVSVLAALAVVVAVNYLSARENKRWDLTASRQNSLSEQTIKVLQGLTSPVKFTVFDQQTNLERFRGRLTEYGYYSKQVSAEYIDPDTKPVIARQYEIDSYGTVVVEYMGRRERATSDSEQDLTNAMIKVMSGQERTVYFLEGHGEKDPMRSERDGYSAVADTLKRDNYKVEKLALAQQRDVPEGATAVVVAGPTTDLLPEEVDSLKRYLARAGKLMVMVDPALEPGLALPNVTALLKEWSIDVGNNIVVDVSGVTQDPSMAVAVSYPAHPVTDNFKTLTVFPVARSVDVIPGGASGHVAQPLVETSQRSWSEVSLDSLKGAVGVKLEPEKGDKAGPITIAVAASAPATEVATPLADVAKDAAVKDAAAANDDAPKPDTRVVVFGDSDFPSNAYGGSAGNLNLFANTVNWLAQQEGLIAIRPKAADDRRVTMTARQQSGVFWTSIAVMPLLVFGTGIWTWWRRRG